MEIRDKLPINFELINNPVNWIIVGLMVLIPAFALALIFHREDNAK